MVLKLVSSNKLLTTVYLITYTPKHQNCVLFAQQKSYRRSKPFIVSDSDIEHVNLWNEIESKAQFKTF